MNKLSVNNKNTHKLGGAKVFQDINLLTDEAYIEDKL